MRPKSLFISYSSEDKDLAHHVLSFLESRGHKCWIAPRDILPAADWAESIIDAIDSSSGMVLLLSRHSNESPQVRREVERAVSRGITIYPLLVERIELSKWMQYYISAHHWHDASDVSLSRRLEELLDAIEASFDRHEKESDLASLSSLLADDLSSLSATLDMPEDRPERLLPGERRKVSVLYIAADLSDHDVPSPVRMATSKTVVNLIERYTRFYDGYLERLSLTGYRCVFGLEQVREDDDRRALNCGICLYNGFVELNSVLSRKSLKVDFGLGIASGMAWADYAGEGSSEPRGEPLLQAQELAERASGELLVTGAFQHSVGGRYSWEEHSNGVYRLDGSSTPLPGHRSSSIRSPFVGREEEMSRLVSLLDRQDSGTGKNSFGGPKHLVMGIRGKAGIGKSRLVHEFIARHCAGNDFAVLRGQTLSHAQPPSWAWTTLLRNLLGVRHGSDLDYEEFRARLIALSDSEALSNSAPFLAELLSIESGDIRLEELDARAVALETSLAFCSLLSALSKNRKLVVVLDDLHWVEESDGRILRFVTENCATESPIVFLLVYRPERKDGTPVEFDISSAFAVWDEMEVSEVDDKSSKELVRLILENSSDEGTVGIAPEAEGFILDRSRGNPFYVEELVFDLLERGVLLQRGGEWKLDESTDEQMVPDTLTGLIQSRLDRLPESWRSVLQNSSVLGMEFQLKLYWKLVNKLFLGRCHLDVFEGLERKQMLLSEMSAFERKYLFRHILVHDTAYSSILEKNLRKLHRAAAESIEGLFPGELKRVSGILMHHYEKAGETDTAIEWGFRALQHYSGEEALKLSRRLEEMLEEQRDEERFEENIFKLLSYREKAEDMLARREEQALTIERMISIAEKSESDYRMAVALKKRGVLSRVTGRMTEARKDFEKALELIRRAGDRPFEGIVLGNLGGLNTNQGRYDDAQAEYEKALEIHHEAGDLRSEGVILMNLGILHKSQGRYDQARKHYEGALEIAHRVGDRRSIGDVLANMGSLLWTQGNPEEAMPYFKRSLEKQQEIGNRRTSGIILSNIAILHMNGGRMDEALEHYERALEIMREAGDVFMEGNILGNMGVVYAEQGKNDEALDNYNKALKIHRSVGNRQFEGVVLGNIGNILLRQGKMDQARTHYEEALEVCREAKNKPQIGCVLGNLGCLCFKEGSVEEAHECYNEAYKIISELKLGKHNLEGFIDLHGKLLSAGYSGDEVPLPPHWEPKEEQPPNSEQAD